MKMLGKIICKMFGGQVNLGNLLRLNMFPFKREKGKKKIKEKRVVMVNTRLLQFSLRIFRCGGGEERDLKIY